jgi:aminopeptidase-like protein
LTDAAERGGVAWSRVPPADDVGAEIYDLLVELFPICRSISGEGVRRSFDIVEGLLPLERTEVPTGTQVFDWTVPPEWNIRSAWITAPNGDRVVDFDESNLHVLNYSAPIHERMPLSKLREHLFVHPTQADWIPYRTSYYAENWGFCVTRRTLDALQDGEYEVYIDSSLTDGSITYAEAFIPGAIEDEVLISTYCCHPSLANDNVSGIALLAVLGKYLGTMNLRRSYRLLFSPGSIGPITWLSRNESRLSLVNAGLVASCLGDPGGMTYKRTRRGDAEIDRAVSVVLRDAGGDYEIRDFAPLGGDERQFCSPGIDLPTGALSRTPADEFRGYHSSEDGLSFVRPAFLGDSFRIYLEVIDVLERNRCWQNTNPKGEPQLGKRGLYRNVGGGSFQEAALLWALNFSDGRHDLLAIAERSGLPFIELAEAAAALAEHELLV